MTDLKKSKVLGAAAVALLALALPAFAQDAAAAAPVADKGDTTWMLISTVLVIAMTIPGLALFYGGLVRAKNMLSVLMQVFAAFCMVALLWVIYGYSLAFTGPAEPGGLSAFIGDFSKLFLGPVGLSSMAETFTKGVYIPEMTFVIFQLTFAAITPALIIGAIAERMKFGAVMLFLAIWFTFSYLPIAHMVWWWGGPSALTGAASGFLFGLGAYDFAGGTVVHINAGIAGLVAAIILGPRKEFLKEPIPPHNLTFTFIGACLLWVGWFGFNAGSNLEANGLTAQALLNTITAPAAAALAWAVAEKFTRGHASLLGAVSGAVAGLVAITPAAGYAGTMGSIVLGAVAGVICLWAVVTLKPRFKYDDALDVFGIHGIGGIVGAIGTAVVAAPVLGGFGFPDAEGNYSIVGHLITQATAVVVALVWSGVVALVAMLIVRAVFGGVRVPESAESDGLDLASHGERAYN
ncbi:MAG: ammonium transporter [Devosia sp.]|uniref:ammonium transporter n=1 Tax=Devosia sp. TaxID=1871048 RepID=UPI002606FF5C|nr:ammonium transporter [Devosia sp.]MDB5541919.1 ammonium transporter [Devosia sp.]